MEKLILKFTDAELYMKYDLYWTKIYLKDNNDDVIYIGADSAKFIGKYLKRLLNYMEMYLQKNIFEIKNAINNQVGICGFCETRTTITFKYSPKISLVFYTEGKKEKEYFLNEKLLNSWIDNINQFITSNSL